MSTSTYDLTPNEWTVITAEAKGSLYVSKGSDVALTQASALPTTEVDDTPLIDEVDKGDDKVYFGIPSGEFIYARPRHNLATITTTPAE